MPKAAKQETDIIPVGDNANAHLKSFIKRIERLEEDKKAVSEDIKDIYTEAKGTGFDVKILRKVIKRRRLTRQKREEEDQLIELYECAIASFKEMME